MYRNVDTLHFPDLIFSALHYDFFIGSGREYKIADGEFAIGSENLNTAMVDEEINLAYIAVCWGSGNAWESIAEACFPAICAVDREAASLGIVVHGDLLALSIGQGDDGI